MDAPTAAVLVATIGAAVSLIQLAVSVRVFQRTGEVHALVNGLAHEKAALLEVAALKEGELRGRDFSLPDAATSSKPPDA